MALDNADFISQLSIIDPTGTDPLNQGDDQIRTVKRATQQSFPNIDAPVPQTAAQMGQMAIKNEANTFTQVNVFQIRQDFFGNARIVGAAGSFRGVQWQDPTNAVREWDWGFNDSTKDFNLRRYVAGVQTDNPISVAQATGTITFAGRVGIAGQITSADGLAAAPGYSFTNNANMGMYRSASNVLNFATAGVDRIALTGTEFNLKSNQIWLPDGTLSRPSYSFSSEINSGWYRTASQAFAFSITGGKKLALDTVSFDLFQHTAAGGTTINFKNSAGFTAYNIQYEGTGGFQPRQFSFSRFNPDTGAFIDIPLYIGVDGRVHSALPVLSP